jgi:hypothetical protein
MATSKKKRARRKLTQEKVDAINRKRLMIQGEPTVEDPGEMVVLEHDNRAGTRYRTWHDILY